CPIDPAFLSSAPPYRAGQIHRAARRTVMAESVYKIVELVGTSDKSWEKAAKAAVETAAQSLRDLRIAEVVALDMLIEEGKVQLFRAKVKLSFKFEPSE
ncbi:MAG: dodecin domain-containing protein, partial [Bacteroidales bacterium]